MIDLLDEHHHYTGFPESRPVQCYRCLSRTLEKSNFFEQQRGISRQDLFLLVIYAKMTDKSPEWALRQFCGRFERPIAINMDAFMKAWSLSPGIIAWVEGDMRPTLTIPLSVSEAELIKQGYLMPYFQETLRSRKIIIEADVYSQPLRAPNDLV